MSLWFFFSGFFILRCSVINHIYVYIHYTDNVSSALFKSSFMNMFLTIAENDCNWEKRRQKHNYESSRSSGCSNEPEESDTRTFDGSPTPQSLSLSALEKVKRRGGGGGKDHNSFEVHLNHGLHILLRKFPLESARRDGVLQAPLGFLSSWNGSSRLGGRGAVEGGGVSAEIGSNPVSYSSP